LLNATKHAGLTPQWPKDCHGKIRILYQFRYEGQVFYAVGALLESMFSLRNLVSSFFLNADLCDCFKGFVNEKMLSSPSN